MLLDCDGTIINTDHVRSFQRESGSKDTEWRTRVTFADGQSTVVNYKFEDLRRLCGHVIPAASGFSVITAYIPDHGQIDFVTLPVVAFRVSDEQDLILNPITTEGEPTDPWALIEPSGAVTSPSQRYESLDAYRADVTGRLEKKRE